MSKLLIATLVFMMAGFGLDNATTYLALTHFAEQVYESNPLARLVTTQRM